MKPLPTNPGDTTTIGIPITLEAFLPYRLVVLAETVSRALSKLYADKYGITIPEWRVLATLGQYPMSTARDVGTHSHMHKTKVSRAVSSLEQRGLLTREKNDRDHRETHLRLTPEGQEIYGEIAPAAQAFAAELMAGLDQDSRDRLSDDIDALTDQAKRIWHTDEDEENNS